MKITCKWSKYCRAYCAEASFDWPKNFSLLNVNSLQKLRLHFTSTMYRGGKKATCRSSKFEISTMVLAVFVLKLKSDLFKGAKWIIRRYWRYKSIENQAIRHCQSVERNWKIKIWIFFSVARRRASHTLSNVSSTSQSEETNYNEGNNYTSWHLTVVTCLLS